MPLLWHITDDEHIVPKHSQEKGVVIKKTKPMWPKISDYCVLNNKDLEKYIVRYEIARDQWWNARRNYQCKNKSMAFPPDLAMFPSTIDCHWLHEALWEDKMSNEEVIERDGNLLEDLTSM